jgi:hypothetical protein
LQCFYSSSLMTLSFNFSMPCRLGCCPVELPSCIVTVAIRRSGMLERRSSMVLAVRLKLDNPTCEVEGACFLSPSGDFTAFLHHLFCPHFAELMNSAVW